MTFNMNLIGLAYLIEDKGLDLEIKEDGKNLSVGLKGSTILTIAHRIKTILSYDRIFVLDKGELIEEGSPQQLIDKKGSFYQLYSKSHV